MRLIITLFLFLCAFNPIGFAQKSKAHKITNVGPPPPPPPYLKKEEVYDPEKNMSIYEKILTHQVLNFEWHIKKDTMLLVNQSYLKHLEFGNGIANARLVEYISDEAVVLDKNEKYNPLSKKLKVSFFSGKLSKDVFIITDDKTNNILKFKLYLDAKKTKIFKIQDLSSMEIYYPADPEERNPTIGM